MDNQNEDNTAMNADDTQTAEGFVEMSENVVETSMQAESEEDHSTGISLPSAHSSEILSFEGYHDLAEDIGNEDEDIAEVELIEENGEEQENCGKPIEDKVEVPDITAHVVSLLDLEDFEVKQKPITTEQSEFDLSIEVESTKSTQLEYEEEYELLLEEMEEQLWEMEEGDQVEEEVPVPFFKKTKPRERVPVKIDLLPPDEIEGVNMIDEDDEDIIFRELLETEEREKAARRLEEERLRKRKQHKDVLEASGAYELIDALAEASVEKSERIDPENVLRHKLDKAKIIRQIKIILADTEEENRKRLLFTKRIFEHFRKKKYKRALIEDDPTTLTDMMKRYRDSLIRLDKAKTKQNLYEYQMETKLNTLRSMEEEKKSELEIKLSQLRTLLKAVGAVAVTSTGPFMQEKEINKIMAKLNQVRKQIAKLRLKYIIGQHTFCSLQQEITELGDLGGGIKIADYEQLKAETFNLGVKVEERTSEIAKLKALCEKDTHYLAHVRERQTMLEEMINKKSEILNALRNNLTNARNYLNELKVSRDSIRKEYQDLSYSSGLLDKPHLLHDYDATVDEITETKSRVDYLKNLKENFQSKLEKNNHKFQQ